MCAHLSQTQQKSNLVRLSCKDTTPSSSYCGGTVKCWPWSSWFYRRALWLPMFNHNLERNLFWFILFLGVEVFISTRPILTHIPSLPLCQQQFDETNNIWMNGMIEQRNNNNIDLQRATQIISQQTLYSTIKATITHWKTKDNHNGQLLVSSQSTQSQPLGSLPRSSTYPPRHWNTPKISSRSSSTTHHTTTHIQWWIRHSVGTNAPWNTSHDISECHVQRPNRLVFTTTISTASTHCVCSTSE